MQRNKLFSKVTTKPVESGGSEQPATADATSLTSAQLVDLVKAIFASLNTFQGASDGDVQPKSIFDAAAPTGMDARFLVAAVMPASARHRRRGSEVVRRYQ